MHASAGCVCDRDGTQRDVHNIILHTPHINRASIICAAARPYGELGGVRHSALHAVFAPI